VIAAPLFPLMNNELLFVVDENDCVLDVRARHIVHADGLRHRAVHILVFDEKGRLFLQKRSMKKDLNAGQWDTSAAGHVDAGEDYEISAFREIEEELGITGIPSLEPLFKLTPTVETGMEFVQVYRIQHNGPFVLAPEEIDEGDWFSSDEISARVHADDPSLTETFKRLWRHLEYMGS
jgi:isopentenyldiphosphate isomerase